MQSYKYTIRIDRSPEQVWAYMMDFSQAPRWRNLAEGQPAALRRAAPEPEKGTRGSPRLIALRSAP